MKSTHHLPPGPKGGLPIGILLALRRDMLGYMQALNRRYGDIVYFKIGPFKVFLLHHPDYIKDVLVTHQRHFIKSRGLRMARRFLGEGLLTSEGDFHLRQRINAYATVMVDYAMRLSERWTGSAQVDVMQEMMRLTMTIVAKTLFDAEVESEADEISLAMTTAMELFERVTNPFAELLNKLPLPSNFRFRKAKKRLDATVYRIINERRAGEVDRGDLLSMLLSAQDVEGDGGMMTDVQVRDEALTLFLAGHETTAIALTWSWYLLSQHHEVEAKLHAEFERVLGDRLPTADDLPKVVYMRMVMAEAMRLYPPAYSFGRTALSEYKIGEYIVPAGSTIYMSPYVIHRDPRYYPDPEKFDPERWTPEAEAQRPKFAYLPFGGGPRVCIGEPFAWMEGILIIATLARRWQMRLVPGHAVALRPLITLRPRYGMQMILERRR